jgi:Lrp/AsnC family transcriptional regulator, leucine-responsive regulatory protein
MHDQTDLNILTHLKKNSRIQWKEIGKAVHMSGQAVAARVAKMTEEGIIRRFTVDTDDRKLGICQSGYITVFMKTAGHADFIKFVCANEAIMEASRISGDGCYLLKFGVRNEAELNSLLSEILFYGNYRLSITVQSVK